MSFSSDVKSELLKIDNISPCCYHAQVYGLVLFAHFTENNFSITTENKQVFNFYTDCIQHYIGCKCNNNNSGTRKYSAYIEDKESIEKAFEKFSHSVKETSVRINHANFQDFCCIASFLRGVFLSCGFISNPSSGYHLEFVVPYKRLSNDLIRVINELDLYPKYVSRKGNHIVYFKDSESIEDFLAFIGAQNSSLYLMNVKIEKDIKNKVNRKLNFEMHNLEKTVGASNSQVEAIKYIKGTSGLGVLPENLKTIAELRLENPEASLSEMESLLDNKLSRSGIKHRLDKIIEFAETLKAESEE